MVPPRGSGGHRCGLRSTWTLPFGAGSPSLGVESKTCRTSNSICRGEGGRVDAEDAACLTTAAPLLLYPPFPRSGFLRSLPSSGSSLISGSSSRSSSRPSSRIRPPSSARLSGPRCSPPPKSSPPLAVGQVPPANSLLLAPSQAEPYFKLHPGASEVFTCVPLTLMHLVSVNFGSYCSKFGDTAKCGCFW